MNPDQPEVLFSRKEIEKKVAETAALISSDYRGKRPLMVGILKGSFVFLADLIRAMTIPVEVDFVILSSYGLGTESSGEVKVICGLEQSIDGRDVIVVEDIVDSGITLSHFLDDLRKRNPASLKLCVLVDKTARREKEVKIDYPGFHVDDEFVVGYGIDFSEQHRHLPDICFVRESQD
jgi:hypoxanthine phosphoribosyltransferase